MPLPFELPGTFQEVRVLLEGPSEVSVLSQDTRDQKVAFINQVLTHFGYWNLDKNHKGLIRRYLERMTGYSRAQVQRSIAACLQPEPPVGAAAFSGVTGQTVPADSPVHPAFKAPAILSGVLVLLIIVLSSIGSSYVAALFFEKADDTKSSGLVSVSDQPVTKSAALKKAVPAKMTILAETKNTFSLHAASPAHVMSTPSTGIRSVLRMLMRLRPTDGQVLVYKGGTLVFEDIGTFQVMLHGAATDDFQTRPGSGRRPFTDTDGSERRFGGGGIVNNSAANAANAIGMDLATGDARYVNITGDTMVGALRISFDGLGLNITGTASGDTIHAEKKLTVSGTTVFDGNARFNSTVTLNGVTYTFPTGDGSASGKVLKTNAAGQLSWSDDTTSGTQGDSRYVNVSGDTMTGALTINLTSGYIGLNVVQTINGGDIHATRDLTASGNLVTEGTFVYGDNAGSFLRLSNANGTILNSGQGLDTTNVTLANNSISFTTENTAIAGMTTSQFFYRGTLSGTRLSVSRNANISGTLLVLNSITSRATVSGSNLYAAKSITGTHLYATQTFGGAGLADCDAAGSSKLMWDSSTKKFVCGSFGTGHILAIGDNRYVKKQGDTMTGALTINLTSGSLGTVGLKVINTLSGAYIRAQNTLASSGVLVVKKRSGTATGNILIVDTTGLVYDGTNKRVGVGTASPSAYLHVLGTTEQMRIGYDTDRYYSTTVNSQGLVTFQNNSSILAGGAAMFTFRGTAGAALGSYAIASFADENGNQMANIDNAGNVTGVGLKTSGGTVTSTSNSAFTFSSGFGSGNGPAYIFDSGSPHVTAFSFRNGGSTLMTILGNAGNVGINTTTPRAKLEVAGSISGSTLFVQSMSGAGLTDCDAATQSLKWDAANQKFSCGTGGAFSTGAVLAIGDGRYVKKQGDTMTGALVINITNGNINTLGLRVLNTISGGVIRAQNTLASSGTLVVKKYAGTGTGNIFVVDSKGLVYDATNKRVGIGTASPSAEMHVVGSIITDNTPSGGTSWTMGAGESGYFMIDRNSGLSPSATKMFITQTGNVGIGLNPQTQSAPDTALEVYRSTGTPAIRITGDGGGSGAPRLEFGMRGGTFDIAQIRTVFGNSYGDPQLQLWVSDTSALRQRLTINKMGTITGAVFVGTNTLASSGSLVWEGAASGATLYVASSINGAGLTDCDAATQVLRWDTTTGRFSCGATGGFSTGAVLSIGDTRYVKKSGDTMTGALVINITSGNFNTIGLKIINTLSGAHLHAEKTLSSSGTLFVESGAYIDGNTFHVAASTNRVGIGTSTPGSDLEISNAAGAWLTLRNNASNAWKMFSHTDNRLYIYDENNDAAFTLDPNNRAGFWDGSPDATVEIADQGEDIFQLSSSSGGDGDFLTVDTLGNVSIGLTTARAKLDVAGSISGATLFVQSMSGAGLTDCDAATATLKWDATNEKFSCNMSGGFSTGAVLAIGDARYVKKSGDTMTGQLVLNMTSGNFNTVGLKVINTLSGAHVHAEKLLTSSGTLVVKGNATFDTNTLFVDSATDRVGIGTAAPGYPLEIKKDGTVAEGNFVVVSDLRNTAGSKGIDLGYDSSGTIGIIAPGGPSAQLAFWTHNGSSWGERMRMDTNGQLGIGTTAPKAKLDVVGTISGSRLSISNNANISGALLVTGVMSGRNLTLSNSASISGTLLVKTSITSKGSVSGSSLFSFGLGDCSSSAKKLTYNNSTGKFSCQDDLTAGTGLEYSTATNIFVNQSGDTMTGALTINVTNGNFNTIGLKLINTLSGAHLHAEKLLTSSGNLIVKGSVSGATINGFNLGSCNGAGQKLLYNYTTQKFECGSDLTTAATFSTGNVLTIGDARYLKRSGGTMTGQLIVDITGGNFNTIGLKVINTASGAHLHAERTLTSSGTFVFEGSASGASLYVATSINGAGLTDCDAATQVLKWDTTTGRFTCGTATNNTFGTGNVLTIGDARYINQSGDTMTGSLTVQGTLSGRHLVVSQSASVSGSLIVLNNTTARGVLSGTHLAVSRSATISGTLLVKNSITSKGSVSGSTVVGFGLGSCNGTSQKVVYNNATNQFACATDNNAGTFGTGNVLTIGDARYVNQSGDTMTGQLVINIANGSFNTIGLKIINTLSGAHLHAEKLLTASGFIIGESGALLDNGTLYVDAGNDRVGIGTTTPQNVFQIRKASNVNLLVTGGIGVAGSIAINAVNDNNSANIPMEFRASKNIFSFGFVGIGTDVTNPLSTLYVSGSGTFKTAAGNANQSFAIKGASSLSDGVTLNAINDTDTVNKGLELRGSTIVLSVGNVGINTASPRAKLEVAGSISGSTLFVQTFSGAGLTDCDATNQKLYWDATNEKFSCGTDYTGSFGTGNVLTIGDARYVNQSGDTMTGALTINVTNGNFNTIGLKVINTLSGAHLHAEKLLTSSGFIIGESGALLDNGTLYVDAGNDRIGIGTMSPTQKLTLNGGMSFLNGNDTFLNSNDVIGLHSNGYLYMQGGTNGAIIAGNLDRVEQVVVDHAGTNIQFQTNSTERMRIVNGGSVGINTSTPRARLEVNGSMSGVTLFVQTFSGAGLTDCDATSQKLYWDATNEKFSCGTDYTGSFGTGNVLTIGDARFVNQSGDTMTGALTINVTNGNFNTIGLKVINTTSGAHLHAERTLTTSGSLIFEGSASGASLYVATSINGAGLTDCDASTQVLKWDTTTGRFVCGTATNNTFGTGNVLTIGDARYVNASGDTMTGSLTVQGTLSGRHLIVSQSASVSGSLIVLNNITARGILSGTHLTVSRSATISGALLVKNSITSKGSVSGSTVGGFGLGNCQGASNKLVFNTATNKFGCAPDETTGTGLAYSTAEGIFVNQGGDTMTGALTINMQSGNFNTIGLKLINTLSGAHLHAEKLLTASGFIIGESGALLDNGTFFVDAGNNRVGIGTVSPETALETVGTMSGLGLAVSRSATVSGALLVKSSITSKGSLSGATIAGFNLGSCNAGTQRLLYNYSTQKFECGIYSPGTFGTGNVLTIGDARYLNQSGDTMTGQLVINITNGNFNTVGLKVINTASGAHLHAEKTLTSSGTLVWEGAASGATLYVATSINGAGLTDCDAATQVLKWDSATGRFICGTGTNNNFGTGNVLTIGDNRYVRKAGDTMTGALLIQNGNTHSPTGTPLLRVRGILSGYVLHGESDVSSSGILLVTQSTIRGSGALVVRQLKNSTGAFITSAATGAAVLVLENATGLTATGASRAPHILFGYSGKFDVALYRSTGAVLNLSGHLLPGINRKFDLGSSAMRWRDLYLSGGTIRMGSQGDEVALRYNNAGDRFGIDMGANGSDQFVVLANGNVGIGTATPDATLSIATSTTGLMHVSNFSIGTQYAGISLNGGTTSSDYNFLSAAGASDLYINRPSGQSILFRNGNAASHMAIDGSNRVGIGTITPETTLEVIGTISGTHLSVSRSATISGALLVKSSITSKGSVSGSTIAGFNLGSCTGSTQKLLYNYSTQKFECGTDQNTGGSSSFGTGNVLTIGDARYVNQSGDTMSGQLVINMTNGNLNTIGLKIINTASGAHLHAERTLTSSGTLMVEGEARFDESIYLGNSGADWIAATGQFITSLLPNIGNTYDIGGVTNGWRNAYFTGVMSGTHIVASRSATVSGALLVKSSITSKGSVSGSTIGGFGLGDCRGAANKLVFNTTTNKFECANDETVGTGLSYSTAEGIFVNQGGDTMTGALVINVTNGNFNTVGLKVINTLSGAHLHAERTLTSSGNLVVEGTASGSTIVGFGLGDCNASTKKVVYNVSTNKFECATDQNTGGGLTYGQAEGIFVNQGGDTMTGALTINMLNGNFNTIGLKVINTASGAHLHAEKRLTASGFIVGESGALLDSGTFYVDAGNNRVGIGTLSPDGKLSVDISSSSTNQFANGNENIYVRNTDSTDNNWSSLYFADGSGDANVAAAIQSKIISHSNNMGELHFSTRTFGQGIRTQMMIDTAGDVGIGTTNPGSRLSVSGAFIVDPTGNMGANAATGAALEVIGTMSGLNLIVSRSASISGALLVKSSITSKGSVSGSTLVGFGLGDCSNATNSKLLYNNSTGKFSCGTDQSGAGGGLTFGQADGIFVKQSGDTMTGALVINVTNGNFNTLGLRIINSASGAHLHAERTLSSSGALVTQSGVNINAGALYVSAASNKVGISTTTPNGFLTIGDGTSTYRNALVLNSDTPRQYFQTNNGAVNWKVSAQDSVSNTFEIGFGSTDTDATDDAYTPILYLNSQARVGIGSSAPKAKLDVIGTISGSRLSISTNANISGSLLVKGVMSGRNLTLSNSASISGSLLVKNSIISKGSVSGSTVFGFGLGDCSNATNSKLLYNNSTGKFSCGSDQTGAGLTFGLADGIFVKQSGDTMTGALVINMTNGNFNTVGLKVINTLSGAHLHAERTLTSSGTLVVEGTMSGSRLIVSGHANISGSLLVLNNITARRTLSGTNLAISQSATISGGLLVRNSIRTKGSLDTRFGLQFLSGALMSEMSGFNDFLNINTAGLGTNSFVRLTNQGNLINIGSIQSGETHMRQGGAFPMREDYTAGTNARTASIGDLNGDGRPDLAVANVNSNTVSILINDGDGTFATKVDYATSTGPIYTAIGDLNGDGKPDLAVVHTGVATLSVFINKGNGTFGASADYSTGSNSQSVAIGELSGDGKMDIAVTNNNSDTVSVYINNGNGTFADKVDYTTGTDPQTVAIGDVNGDGKADMAVTNNNAIANTVSVFLNKGAGVFAAKKDYTTASTPYAVAIGDVNGDGKADMAVTNGGANSVSIFRNNGDGTFAAKVDYATGSGPRALALGDVNGDGKADLAVPNVSADTVSILLNKGNGTFATKVDYALGASSGPIFVDIGDLDGDGKADLAVANSSTTTVSVMINITKTILFAGAGTGGRVGIGTNTPGDKLTVSGGILIDSDETTHTNNAFKIITNYSSANNTVFRISASGSVYADGKYNSAGADYAEWFIDGGQKRQEGQERQEGLKPGEVVCIDILEKNAVIRCERSADPNVMGIVSTHPAFVGNAIGGADGIIPPGYVLVGLIGQVPAKVMIESGAVIRPGDSLTSASVPGFARKAKAGESTVGVALEGFDGSSLTAQSSPLINVLISRRNQSLTVETVEQKVLDSIASMNISDEVSRLVSTAAEQLEVDTRIANSVQMQLQSLDITAEVNAAIDRRFSGSAAILDFGLSLSDEQIGRVAHAAAGILRTDTGATFTDHEGRRLLADLRSEMMALKSAFTGGVLRIAHLEVERDAIVRGTLRIGSGMTFLSGRGSLGPIGVSGSHVTIGSLVSTGSLKVVGPITISGLATFLGDVRIGGQLVLSSKQAGFAVIPMTGTSVTVRFDTPMIAVPMVQVTPHGRVGAEWWVGASSATGFMISVDKPLLTNVTFAWMAIAADRPRTLMGTGAVADGQFVPFHIDTEGRPYSLSNSIWNQCIIDPLALDACNGFHQGSLWFAHPDIVETGKEPKTFTFDATVGAASLVLPPEYLKTVVTLESESSSSAMSSSESSGTSSESSVSSSESSSASSESPASSESSSSVSSESSSSASSQSSMSSSESSSASSEPLPPPPPAEEPAPAPESADPAPAPTI